MTTPNSNGTEPITIQMFTDAITHSEVQVWLIISAVINIILVICAISCIWFCLVHNKSKRHHHRSNMIDVEPDDALYPGATTYQGVPRYAENSLKIAREKRTLNTGTFI